MNYSANLKQYFGYLPQLDFIAGEACTPTSATNALTYIVSKPGFSGGEYAPLSSYSGWESVRDDLATNYFYTSPNSNPPGTFPALAIIGMNQYLVKNGLRDHVSLSTIGVSTDPDGRNIAGWDRPEQNGFPAIGPVSQYSQLFTEQRVTGEFLRASLLRSDAILAGGFYSTTGKDLQGHAVLITDLNWTDKNANGVIDAQDGATVSILDPLDPSQSYSPELGSYIGYGEGSTTADELADALNTKVTATGDALFKTGSIVQNGDGFLVVQYVQSSLTNVNGTFENVGGDSSNGKTEVIADMTLMLSMSLGTNGLPDSVDRLIEQDMPHGTFVFDVSVFGGHKLEGYIYTNEESAYQNTLQFYSIEGADGTIRHPDTGEPLAPGDEGYAALALQLATEFSALDMADRVSLNEEQLTAFLKDMGDDLDSVMFAPVVTTSAGDNWFAFEQANADKLVHFKELAPNTYGFEDMFGLGDGDFNDLVFQLIPIRMEELPLGFLG